MTKETLVAESLIPRMSYVFVQSALLFAVYGMGYSLPSWVKWFPTIIYGGMVIIILLILLIMLIAAAITS